jgi:hypothetical protein
VGTAYTTTKWDVHRAVLAARAHTHTLKKEKEKRRNSAGGGAQGLRHAHDPHSFTHTDM